MRDKTAATMRVLRGRSELLCFPRCSNVSRNVNRAVQRRADTLQIVAFRASEKRRGHDLQWSISSVERSEKDAEQKPGGFHGLNFSSVRAPFESVIFCPPTTRSSPFAFGSGCSPFELNVSTLNVFFPAVTMV